MGAVHITLEDMVLCLWYRSEETELNILLGLLISLISHIKTFLTPKHVVSVYILSHNVPRIAFKPVHYQIQKSYPLIPWFKHLNCVNIYWVVNKLNLQEVFCKEPDSRYFRFTGQMVYVVSVQLCCRSVKAATGKM